MIVLLLRLLYTNKGALSITKYTKNSVQNKQKHSRLFVHIANRLFTNKGVWLLQGQARPQQTKSNQEVAIMCMTKKELESKVEELRSLKTMKEEIENELKAVEHSIIEYMTENEIDTEFVPNAKITYKPQSRTTLDKEKLTEVLGEDLKPFEKTTSYNVLRVK